MTDPDTPNKLGLSLRCAHCNYFIHTALFKGETGPAPCSKLGRADNEHACDKFALDGRLFSTWLSAPDKSLSDLLPEIPTKMLPAFAALIRQEAVTRRYGYHFGQEVVINVGRGDYASNYAKARVVYATKEHIFVEGTPDFRVLIPNTQAAVDATDRWQKKRDKLRRLSKEDNVEVAPLTAPTYSNMNPDIEAEVVDRFVNLRAALINRPGATLSEREGRGKFLNAIRFGRFIAPVAKGFVSGGPSIDEYTKPLSVEDKADDFEEGEDINLKHEEEEAEPKIKRKRGRPRGRSKGGRS